VLVNSASKSCNDELLATERRIHQEGSSHPASRNPLEKVALLVEQHIELLDEEFFLLRVGINILKLGTDVIELCGS
jgi:hypothetical protein